MSHPQLRGNPYLLLLAGEIRKHQRHKRAPHESPEKDSPSTKWQRLSRRADEWVEVRATSRPLGGNLPLKADEPQRYEDFERNWEYQHIITFPEWT